MDTSNIITIFSVGLLVYFVIHVFQSRRANTTMDRASAAQEKQAEDARAMQVEHLTLMKASIASHKQQAEALERIATALERRG
ncbi:hypothetical protein V8J82_15670 [Gymnodinialimonas sp. 2305UL16-5]|uniref:hypothetical protein n=1 Tax=Gymnodinialimonas mytili TaxID=3126503 RepID=UPI0030B6C011